MIMSWPLPSRSARRGMRSSNTLSGGSVSRMTRRSLSDTVSVAECLSVPNGECR